MAASVVKCFIRHIQSSACLHSGLTTLPYGTELHVLVCRFNIPLSVSVRGSDVASTPVCVHAMCGSAPSVRWLNLQTESCSCTTICNPHRSCELLCGQFNIAKEEITNYDFSFFVVLLKCGAECLSACTKHVLFLATEQKQSISDSITWGAALCSSLLNE